MANICENEVRVSGPSPKIDEFLEKYFCLDEGGKKSFTMDKEFPPPVDEDYGLWHERMFHTRWMNTTTSVDKRSYDSGKAVLEFVIDTPWGPPRDLLTSLSESCKDLRIFVKYLEPDLDESGVFEVEGGKVLRDC